MAASLLFISIFSPASNPHAYSECCGQSVVLSRGRAQVRREVSPASTVLFVDSSLMKMGIVLNDMTEHKAALQMKTLCARMNDDDFFCLALFCLTILLQHIQYCENYVQLMQAGRVF